MEIGGREREGKRGWRSGPLKALWRSMASWRGLGGAGGRVRLAIAGDRCGVRARSLLAGIRFDSIWSAPGGRLAIWDRYDLVPRFALEEEEEEDLALREGAKAWTGSWRSYPRALSSSTSRLQRTARPRAGACGLPGVRLQTRSVDRVDVRSGAPECRVRGGKGKRCQMDGMRCRFLFSSTPGAPARAPSPYFKEAHVACFFCTSTTTREKQR